MTAALDALLGRVTMYRLVLLCLGTFLALALVLSLLGLVRPGDALAMLASAAVLAAVSYGANRLFALLFRTRGHTPSALITAGLLFFILPPAIDPAGLATLTLAALIAVASKYLLAIRGRHVLNPAATGAFAIGLTGLGFGQWWIGTAWPLPFVAIGAAAVLFRTRRLPLGGTYVAVGLIVGVAQYVLNGTPLPTAFSIVLLSSPLGFVAGFMLSEPLTLPPRRWQQFASAALVAILTQVPFQFGPLYNSPELALLVGNVLAFLAGQRRGIRLDYLGRRQLTPSSWEFAFRPLAPVRFVPGQFMELTLPHAKTDSRGWRRLFSIAAAPEPGGVLRFATRLPHRASSFKRALLDLEPGTRVTATSVGGDLVLPADPRRPLLLVAGGIGITPFISHLAQILAEGVDRDLVLVYAVSSNDDLAYLDSLVTTGFRVAIASPEEPPGLPPEWLWLGPGRLTGDALLAAVPDAATRDAYLSGPPALVAALARALRQAGARCIRRDVFIGY